MVALAVAAVVLVGGVFAIALLWASPPSEHEDAVAPYEGRANANRGGPPLGWLALAVAGVALAVAVLVLLSLEWNEPFPLE